MSLFGALSSSVSGLSALSDEIAEISNNIANVSTTGYKEGESAFQTLVTGSSSAGASSGGVDALSEQLIDQQGQIQTTESPTDLAISGDGFFVVNSTSDGTGTTAFTRAGSFTEDSTGNFVNSAGEFLMAWPLSRTGLLPGAPGNTTDTTSANDLSSLEIVNVQEATSNAAETTAVALSANLNAGQAVYPGAAATASMDANTVNTDQPATSIIVPDVVDGTDLSSDVDSIQSGDRFTVSTGTGTSYTYTYGGFSYSRDVASGALGDSDEPVQPSPLQLNGTPFTATFDSATVTVNAANSGLVAGDVVTLAGSSGANIGSYAATAFNGSFVVQSANASGFTIEMPTEDTDSTGSPQTGGVQPITVTTRPFAGNILDATSPDGLFLGTTGTSSFSSSALSFDISVATSTGNVTSAFTYTASTPDAQLGQFNTLDNLATAISASTDLTARVSDGRLYVSATNPNDAVTFTNGSTTGSGSGTSVLSGIDWVGELGLQDIPASTNTFNSLQSLASQINASSGLTATVSNALTDASLSINVNDPLDTISFGDPAVATPVTLNSSTPFTTTAAGGSSNGKTVTINTTQLTGLKAGDLVTLSTPSPDTSSESTQTSKFTTTIGSKVVGITLTTGLATAYTAGQQIYIDPSSLPGYPDGTIGGIPMTDLKGDFTVLSTSSSPAAPANPSSTVFYIEAPSAATSVVTAGDSGTLTTEPTFNGIPISDLNGQFVVQSAGASGFTINVADAADVTGTTGVANVQVTPPTNSGSMLAELGLVSSLDGASYTPQSLGPLGPEYDADDSSKNMAGGVITPQYSQNIQIYDSLGTPHNLTVSFIKTNTNTWAVEVYDTNTSEVSANYTDGLLASGSLVFNGDGSLRSVSSGLSSPVDITWTDGAVANSVAFNWGTAGEPAGTVGASQIGETNGMSQFDAAYAVNFANQNGNAVGEITGVSVTSAGIVTASFSNGLSENLFQIPLAVFSAPDQLEEQSGNIFTQTNGSGDPNLRQTGTGGAGTIQSSALESSTVDLATELTNLIVAQNAYSANAKAITITDQLLQTLDQAVST